MTSGDKKEIRCEYIEKWETNMGRERERNGVREKNDEIATEVGNIKMND